MTGKNTPTIADVAQWMLSQAREAALYQDTAAWDIKRKFGTAFVYDNDHGNPAILKAVLDEFRKISGNSIVWCRGDRYWRKRVSTDMPGRQQD